MHYERRDSDDSKSPEINGRPAGDYTLPGRADLADLALDPSAADLFKVTASAKKIIRTLPPGEISDFRKVVEDTFFGPSLG